MIPREWVKIPQIDILVANFHKKIPQKQDKESLVFNFC